MRAVSEFSPRSWEAGRGRRSRGPAPVSDGPSAGEPVHRECPVRDTSSAASWACPRSVTCLCGGPGTLLSVPSRVTVIIDAAEPVLRELRRGTELDSLPQPGPVIGIDLGSPTSRFCRTAGRSHPHSSCAGQKRCSGARQQDLSRKQQGSKNQTKARLKLARAHARVSDARRDFHHQLLHGADPRQPSGRRRGPSGEMALADAAGEVRPRCRMGQLRDHAGIGRGPAVWRGSSTRSAGSSQRHQVCSACGIKDGPKPLHVRDLAVPRRAGCGWTGM